MHDSVMKWVGSILTPDMVGGKSVLEVGSRNVNGSIRPLFEALGPSHYFGIDAADGNGVDRVIMVESYADARGECVHDVVVSCEMLEHASDWRAAFSAMCELAHEHIILTARGPGFPRHNPPDHWRFTCEDLITAATYCGFDPEICIPDPQVPGVFLLARRMAWPTVQRAPGGLP